MPVTNFAISRQRGETISTISIAGELDIASVAELRQAASEELANEYCRTLILDLAELTFLDSTALGCWVELNNQANQFGKHLLLRAVSEATMRVLTLGGLASLFDLSADHGSQLDATS